MKRHRAKHQMRTASGAIHGTVCRQAATDRTASTAIASIGYNYAPDAGAGSQTFAGGGGMWRAALLGSVAAGAILAGLTRAAKAGPDACYVVGNVATCQGDQSDGIANYMSPAIETLNVNSLTANITPGVGDGINLSANGDGSVTIDAQLGNYAIIAPGDGIYGVATVGYNFVDITVAGDITASFDGIQASAVLGPVTIDSTGNITASYDGIAASTDGDITIGSTGDIDAGSRGIYADSYDGNISITSDGNIASTFDAIGAETSYDGAITIASTGDLTSDDDNGISAVAEDGEIAITTTGDITSGGRGIEARTGSGAITVESTGDLDSSYHAIFANTDGDITITSTGDIVSGQVGINAGAGETFTINSTGNISATSFGISVSAGSSTDESSLVSEGDIASANFDAIRVTGLEGGVTVTSDGELTAAQDGLDISADGDVTVASTGNITVGFEGIRARSFYGATTVTSTGDIVSGQTSIYGYGDSVSITSSGSISSGDNGILAQSYGSGPITISSTGDIAADYDGIRAYSNTDVDIDITSIGNITADDDGISAATVGTVTVNSTGDITAGSDGVSVNADYGATITSTGTVSAEDFGLRLSGDGFMTLESVGNISAINNNAILVDADNFGEISISSTGDLSSGDHAIYADTPYGSITIESDGNITSDEDGIRAFTDHASVDISSTGNIEVGGRGINAATNTVGSITIVSSGEITSTGDDAIFGFVYSVGDISVTSDGNLAADGYGIRALNYNVSGTVGIDNSGDITSTAQDGIRALAQNGDIVITSSGDITASDDGIQADARDANITITSIGDITSGSTGIEASADFYGNIAITSTGNITASSYGIDAQALYGDITIVSTGDIVVDDDYAGIRADSQSGSVTIQSTGDIGSSTAAPYRGVDVSAFGSADVTLGEGKVYGADYGVYFDDVYSSTLKNYGDLSGGDFAIKSNNSYPTSSDTVENFGIVTGDVDLGGGINSFLNRLGGEFRSGGTVDLGGGLLTNEGVLSPGGVDAVQITALTGDLVQTADGSFTVDIDQSGAGVDKLTISGTADFAGLVVPNIIDLQSTSGQFIIADASSVTLNGAEAQDQGFIDFGLTTPGGGTQLALTFAPRSLTDLVFGPLTGNQRAVAHYLEAVGLSNPTPEQMELFDNLFDLPDEASLLAALDQLSPEHYLAQAMGTWFASAAFVRGAMSCPEPGAAGALVREGQCYWARVEGRRLDWDRTRDDIGGDETAWSLTAGLQAWLGEGWLGGGALSYERSDIDSDNGASADGDRFQGALTLKRDWQDFSMGAAVFASHGSFDTARPLGLAMPGSVATGDQDIFVSGAHLRLSQTHDRGEWYLRPMVDLNLTYLSYGDLRESGAGDLSLDVREEDEWLFSASPAIEIGGTMRLADGTVVQPYARAGLTWLSDDSIALSAGFADGADGIGPFTVSAEFDHLLADLSAGVVALSADGVSLRAGYDGRFGEDVEQHSGSVKVGVTF